ncbi:MAG: translation initiation factor IF-2, partial [Bacteroidota bacterium]
MPIRKASVRLSKAAKEFNVGIQTIVDTLADKGFEIESKPNSKIEPAAYEILMEEFQDSKQLKEKAKSAGVVTANKETVTIEREAEEKKERTEEKEEVLVKNTQSSAQDVIRPEVKAAPGLSVVGKIDLDKDKKAAKPVEEKKEEAPAEEAAPAEESKPVEAAKEPEVEKEAP